MTYRVFDVPKVEKRDVGFTLAGEDFACVDDISMGTMEDYRAQFVPNADDPTKVGIPLEAATHLIEASLYPSAADAPDEHEVEVERFRKVRRDLPFDNGGEAIHAIREYLIEVYTKTDPTTGLTLSQDGPSAGEPTSPADSGSTE